MLKAVDVINMDAGQAKYLGKQYIFVDSTNQLSFQEVISIEPGSFKPYTPENSQVEPGNTYWIKFYAHHEDSQGLIYIYFKMQLEDVSFFIPCGTDTFCKQQAGLSLPFSKWYLHYRKPFFVLPKGIPDTACCYFKINVQHKTGTGISFMHHRKFFNNEQTQLLFYGLFFGIIFIAAFFSLIFFIRMHEKAYLFYSLYVLSFALFAAVDWGLIIYVISGTGVAWSNDLYTIPFMMITVFLLLYAKHFIDTKKNMPAVNRVINICILARISIYIIGALFQLGVLYNPYIDNLLLLPAFIAAIISLKKRYKPARYLVLAFTVLYSGLLFHTFNYLFRDYSLRALFSIYKTGTVEIVLFSLALADRFRNLKNEKEDVQLREIKQLRENARLKEKYTIELENKVAERTDELEKANEKVRAMNEMLKSDNLKLALDVKNISRKRIMQSKVSFAEFKEIYPDKDSCFKFLEKLKWGNGFICKKCGNTKYSKGNAAYSRRCSRCGSIEQVTEGTIFKRIKFPITKAFYILFLLSLNRNISVDELSRTVDLRRQTCWYFKKKVLNVMQNSKRKSSNWPNYIFSKYQG